MRDSPLCINVFTHREIQHAFCNVTSSWRLFLSQGALKMCIGCVQKVTTEMCKGFVLLCETHRTIVFFLLFFLNEIYLGKLWKRYDLSFQVSALCCVCLAGVL